MQIREAKIEDVDTVVQILISSRLKYLPYAKSPHSQTEMRHWVRKKFIPTGDVWLA